MHRGCQSDSKFFVTSLGLISGIRFLSLHLGTVAHVLQDCTVLDPMRCWIRCDLDRSALPGCMLLRYL
ncbi:MAG: hypothetical protein DMF21_07830 [Verrucomicrobia bacterium]|nr:MAG: hypothetical protein DMF21_07830 [Verrucomicrobiota bacterium]